MQNIIKQIRRYDIQTIYTCSSIYNLLLALCIVLIINDFKNSYIIMFSPEKKVLEAFYMFADKMKALGINAVVINKHTRLHRLIGVSEIKNLSVYTRVINELKVTEDNFLLINFSWNQRMVRYPASIYLRKCKEAIFIEEGATQWITPDEKVWHRLLKRLYGNQTEFWRMDKVRFIYVQQPDKFPDYLKSKLLKFKLENCFEKISEITKKDLLQIFLDEKSRDELIRIKKVDGIIFTQPISEDGFVSEEEKIRIYKELSEFYLRYGRVALKVHPRDITEYRFKDIDIMKGTYPSEILNILNVRFKFAVGLCTSAVETVEADIKINLNERFLNELKYELQKL